MNKIYKNLDMFIISVWIIAAFAFIMTPTLENSPIRTILGIPMILFIPGYILISVLFPKKDDLDIVGRIALSFGLSIAVVSILGLILNFTFGIRLISILMVLCIYTIVLVFATIYKRRELSEDVQFSIQLDGIFNAINDGLRPKNRSDLVVTIILIFTMMLAIGMMYHAIVTPKVGEKFTEFYVLNSSGKTYNHSDLRFNSSLTLLIGVTNHEHSPVNYTIQVALDKNILTSRELTLNHDQIWENYVTLLPEGNEHGDKLELLLFKENDLKTPYRSLYLWMNST